MHHLFWPPITRGISPKVLVRSWHYLKSRKGKRGQSAMWPSGITSILCNRAKASKKILPMVYFYCLNCGGKKGPAAGSILHHKNLISRRAHHAFCCSMHFRGLRHGDAHISNQGSQRGHSHGRMDADPMVLVLLQFAR